MFAAQLERAQAVAVDLAEQLAVEVGQHPVPRSASKNTRWNAVFASKNPWTSPRRAAVPTSRRSRARARATSSPVSCGTARRTAIVSSASRTWYASMNSSLESARTTAPRRGRIVTSPSVASRPSASRTGPRLTPSDSASATSESSVPGRQPPRRGSRREGGRAPVPRGSGRRAWGLQSSRWSRCSPFASSVEGLYKRPVDCQQSAADPNTGDAARATRDPHDLRRPHARRRLRADVQRLPRS